MKTTTEHINYLRETMTETTKLSDERIEDLFNKSAKLAKKWFGINVMDNEDCTMLAIANIMMPDVTYNLITATAHNIGNMKILNNYVR